MTSIMRADGRPTIRAGVISPAAVQRVEAVVPSSPDQHFSARPDRRLKVPARRCVNDAGGGPTVSRGVVPPAGVQNGATPKSTPHDHFASRPNCRETESSSWRVGGTHGSPTVGSWIVYSASICLVGYAISTPHDHFAPCPDGRVDVSGGGRIGGVCSRPIVGNGIVYPAGVEILRASTIIQISAPDDHFAPRPNCGVKAARRGCVGGVRGCPTIGSGIVIRARVVHRPN
jgi:hypothetical protein